MTMTRYESFRPPMPSKRPPITHVAVRFRDKVYSLPRPNRHHNVILQIAAETGVSYVDSKGDDQGFLDESGRYLMRKAAMVSAKMNEQVSADIDHAELYSEDLW